MDVNMKWRNRQRWQHNKEWCKVKISIVKGKGMSEIIKRQIVEKFTLEFGYNEIQLCRWLLKAMQICSCCGLIKM